MIESSYYHYKYYRKRSFNHFQERDIAVLKRTYVMSTCILVLILGLMLIAPVYGQTDTVRLVCVGNSITEGASTMNNPALDNYPAQLAVLLGSGWSVLNSGVSGRTMLKNGDFPIWNEQRFKDGLNYSPDIVTISLGTNDTKPFNWDDHKGEFITDYYTMIDTFRSLPSHPAIWLCLPPPSFSDAFSIRDSVINADIIPMIQQIAAVKSCQIIDFNTLMKPHTDLFPDGIHPSTIGSAMMSEYMYGLLTGRPIVHVTDENCTSGKRVTVSGSIDTLIYGGANLVDADTLTFWKTIGFPAEAVVDLGAEQTVDFFRIDFGNARDQGYQFRIETAGLAAVPYTTIIDRTARVDSASFIMQKTDSIHTRFIRLVITGAAHPKGDTVAIAGFRALKANSSAHGPVIVPKKISATGSNAKYNITIFWPDSLKASMMIYRTSSLYGAGSVTGFREGATTTIKNEYIKIGAVNTYWAVSFLNGVETVSDTVIVDTNTSDIDEADPSNIPSQIALYPAYPNPFNPSTTISFTLPSTSNVILKIFDIMGREISTLVSGRLNAGLHSRQWDAVNMPTGVYFYRLQADNSIKTERLVLLK
jgi:lysophospholipase L1-like esterase